MRPLFSAVSKNMWLVAAVLLVALALTLCFSLRQGAPWIPTSTRTIRAMLALLALAPGETLVDLGSGDGRILIRAAKQYGVRGIGFEVNPVLVTIARWRVAWDGLSDRIEIRRADIFQVPMPKAQAVTLFLFQNTNQRVRDLILPQLTSGTRVVSYGFTFEGRTPVETRTLGSGPAIFLYHL